MLGDHREHSVGPAECAGYKLRVRKISDALLSPKGGKLGEPLGIPRDRADAHSIPDECLDEASPDIARCARHCDNVCHNDPPMECSHS
jgi:hypothetical protein